MCGTYKRVSLHVRQLCAKEAEYPRGYIKTRTIDLLMQSRFWTCFVCVRPWIIITSVTRKHVIVMKPVRVEKEKHVSSVEHSKPFEITLVRLPLNCWPVGDLQFS